MYIRATANPGGVGHGWVKERFITAGRPMSTIWEAISWMDKSGKEHHEKQSRIFVPSSVFDNPALLRNDPDDSKRLASMAEADRNALLYGYWDSFSGQVFTEMCIRDRYYHDTSLTNAVSKRMGWYRLAQMMGLPIKDSETYFGKRHEESAKEMLIAKGFEVRRMPQNFPYDLFVNDRIKVDVKASRLYQGPVSYTHLIFPF